MNVANLCLAVQDVNSAPMLVMVHVSLHCLAVTIANVDRFVKLFRAVMGVNANIFVVVCRAVTVIYATFVNVFKDVKFAIV